MILGWDAPMPPAKTGVAEYAERLMRALREKTIVVMPGQKADRWIYHIGNNHLHLPILARALDRPGVVVLHDAVLMHFYLGSLDEAGFVEEFTYNYGEWHRDYALDLWRRRASSGSAAEYFRYPMLKRLAESAQMVVVHNPVAARMVAEHSRKTPVRVIPHYWEAPRPAPADTMMAWRQAHGVTASTYLFGIFGYLRESKRLLPLLRAFQRVSGCKLLVAGDFASTDLERAAEPLLAQPNVIRIGATDPDEFQLLTEVVDCCVNLRYPSAGETSGITIRLMGLGKPVILTKSLETSELPEATCLLVDAGASEEPMLREMMQWLVDHPGQGRAIGRRAAYHIQQHHSIDAVAQQYLEAANLS